MAVKFKNSININDQYTLPSTVGLTNQYLKVNDAATGELVFADLGEAAQVSTIAYEVRNETGVSIPKGSVVYISGGSGSSDHVTIALSSASSEATSSKTFGITAETIANNSTGDVVLEGLIEGLDTSAFTSGGTLWLGDTAGSIQGYPPPSTPSHAVFVGYAVRAQQNNGSLFVKIQNGYELEELHNVLVTSATDGQVLTWDAANSYWKNTSPISGDGTFSVDTDIFTANGVQTDFTLSYPIASENNVQVYIDGVYQSKDNYTTSGTTLTFAVAPPNTTSVEAVHIFAVDVSPVATNEFVGNGVQTTFTLSQSLPSQSRTMVFIEGVYQEKSTYTLNGTDIVFTTAPQNGYSIEVMSLGSVIAGANSLESVIAGSGISVSTVGLDSTITNTAPDQTVSLTGLNGTAVTGTYPDFTINTSSLDGRITTAEGNISTLQSTIIDGSGTANYVTKWADADTITNSVIYDDGTNVGIGTNSPNSYAGYTTLNLNGITGGFLDFESNGTRVGSFLFNNASGVLKTQTAIPLVFATSDTERMRITSAGNIGINTAAPDSTLHIVNSSGGSYRLGYAGTTDVYFDTNNFYVRAGDGSTNKLIINSSGNVGIGTTNPAANLHIKTSLSAASSEEIALRVESSPSGGNPDRQIELVVKNDGTATNTYGLLRLGDHFTNANTPSKVLISATGDSYLNGGNVGIGTSSPSNTAHIYKNNTLGSPTAPNISGAGLRIQDNSNSLYFDGNAIVQVGAGNFEIGSATTSMKLITNGAERMIITSAGNVGIGTTVPGSILHIEGSITSAALQVNQTGTGILANFKQAGNSKVVIDNTGNVGIGSTVPGRKLEIRGDRDAIIRLENNRTVESANQILGAIEFYGNDTSGPGAGVRSSIVARTAGGGEASYLTFSTTSTVNDTERMRLQSNGDLHVDGDVIAYSTTISDKRLKDDVQTIDNALDKVSNLRGVSYTWNNGNRKGQKDLGLIAQEVEQVLPELVREKEMPMIDGGTYKTVDYEKIVGVLIEAVKELTDKVNKLESR